jgi:hypothetical protein
MEGGGGGVNFFGTRDTKGPCKAKYTLFKAIVGQKFKNGLENRRMECWKRLKKFGGIEEKSPESTQALYSPNFENRIRDSR